MRSADALVRSERRDKPYRSLIYYEERMVLCDSQEAITMPGSAPVTTTTARAFVIATLQYWRSLWAGRMCRSCNVVTLRPQPFPRQGQTGGDPVLAAGIDGQLLATLGSVADSDNPAASQRCTNAGGVASVDKRSTQLGFFLCASAERKMRKRRMR